MGKLAKKASTLSQGGLAELKSRLLFVLFGIIIFRIGAHVPVPGLNLHRLADFFNQHSGGVLGLFNMFSGGALSRLTVFALGVTPYISVSIIVQLFTMVVPALEQLKKEGESGRRKISQYTRYGTVVLATFQSIGISIALQSQTAGGMSVVLEPGLPFVFITTISLVTGTVFLMWLGEQVTERGIGNGISMIIFAGIVSGLPKAVGGTLELARTGEMNSGFIILLFLLSIAVTAIVVFVERGQRKILLNYPKRQEGRKLYSGQTSFLPLKINMAGVIPPIFASSIILFPATLAGWFSNTPGFEWLQDVSTVLSPGQPIYVLFYASAIIFFCFFYTALVFNSKETSENLKKSGAFLPGIRPGIQTTQYIDKVITRLTLIGAFYITIVCLLPEFLIVYWNVPFYFGGTSLLIIVVVVMDFISQMQTHIMSKQYEGLLKKSNLKK